MEKITDPRKTDTMYTARDIILRLIININEKQNKNKIK